MVVVALLLLTLSTIHIAVDIKRIYSGLVLYRDTYPGGPLAWFANEREPSFVFKNIVYPIQTALGDGVVIYRSYMVWRSVWVIMVPFILWLGVCTTGIGTVYELTQPAPTSSNIFASRTGQWITSFYAITLSCNFIATGRGLMPVLMIVIDAGALYSFTLLAALIGFVNQSNGIFVVLDMIPPIISIAFYMVILRVGLAQRTRATSSTSTFQRTPLPRNEMRPMQYWQEIKFWRGSAGPTNTSGQDYSGQDYSGQDYSWCRDFTLSPSQAYEEPEIFRELLECIKDQAGK
ncbi:hypothetical protein B0H13DRAFT_2494470 [Mycena leptocephala]|nr:hypothetical protein B0H13DRAFT_2494470 [Mycena leptocephala]